MPKESELSSETELENKLNKSTFDSTRSGE